MTKLLLKDLLRKTSIEGDIGIEVEVEAAGRLPVVNNKFWSTKADSSLRNGVEYVTKGALNVDEDLLTKIKRLTDTFKPEQLINKNAHRTSIHIHRNVLELTVLEVWTILAAGWLSENLLLKYCGDEREGNLFCLRLKDAEAVMTYVTRDLESGSTPFLMLDTDSIRYASQNLSAIPQYGSIEYRAMRGTIDPDIIHTWGTNLFDMGEGARSVFHSPEELLDFYFKNGYKRTLAIFFKEPFLSYLLSIKKGEDLVEESALNMTNFAYAVDWNNYYDKVIKYQEKYQSISKGKIPQETSLNIRWNTVRAEMQAAWPSPEIAITTPRARARAVNPAVAAAPPRSFDISNF